MRWIGLACSLACFTGAVFAAASSCAQDHQPGTPTVILISLDGFRPDYLDRNVTPNLNALATSGVRSAAMIPSFPPITFPNHYTLVTGLRPDEHGVVGNVMEDRAIPGVKFSMSNREAVIDRRWWDGGEPVWVTAEKHGIRTATMFWPGSEADIGGVRPSHWSPFDSKIPPEQRVDTVLGWLDEPESTRPYFLTLYLEDVDHDGHVFGPDSPQVTAAAAKVDAAIGRLRSGLTDRHLHPDIIVVSDHGMAATSPNRVILLDRIAAPGSYRLVASGPYAGIEPTSGHERELSHALLKRHGHMQCWRKDEMPRRFHYGNNSRIPAFVCIAEVGWLIINGDTQLSSNRGAHGYDNRAPEMRAIFLASGPDFRQGVTVATFENVDIYPLIMRLLHLGALPNDGTIRPFASALIGK